MQKCIVAPGVSRIGPCVQRMTLAELAEALGRDVSTMNIAESEPKSEGERTKQKKAHEHLVAEVLRLSALFPEWGATRLQRALEAQGTKSNRETVQQVLIDHDRGRLEQRLLQEKEA